MAISLGDALGISEVRLPRQSVVAFGFRVRRLCQNVSVYGPDCMFRTMTGFWEVTPVNHGSMAYDKMPMAYDTSILTGQLQLNAFCVFENYFAAQVKLMNLNRHYLIVLQLIFQ